MAQYADYADFGKHYFGEGVWEDDPDSQYGEYPPKHIDYDTFAAEVANVVGQVKVLVVGCAYGVSLRAMRVDQSIDQAAGMEYSQYAVDNALGDVADQVYQGDARNQARFGEIAQDVQGPPSWDAIYTEFVLSHYDDAQAQEIHDNCVAEADSTVIHRIWSGTGAPGEDDVFNLKTVSEWQNLLSTDPTVDIEFVDYDRPEDSTI